MLVKYAAERVESDPLVRTRFLRDAGAAAAVSHPNVATLFEVVDRQQNPLFFVFEFATIAPPLAVLAPAHGVEAVSCGLLCRNGQLDASGPEPVADFQD